MEQGGWGGTLLSISETLAATNGTQGPLSLTAGHLRSGPYWFFKKKDKIGTGKKGQKNLKPQTCPPPPLEVVAPVVHRLGVVG